MGSGKMPRAPVVVVVVTSIESNRSDGVFELDDSPRESQVRGSLTTLGYLGSRAWDILKSIELSLGDSDPLLTTVVAVIKAFFPMIRSLH